MIMDLSQFLVIIGLFLNTIASILLLYPFLNIWKDVDDDFIEEMKNDGKYYQKKHKKDRVLGIIGAILFIIGFIFQIFGTLVVPHVREDQLQKSNSFHFKYIHHHYFVE
jgi:hypothetical protein